MFVCLIHCDLSDLSHICLVIPKKAQEKRDRYRKMIADDEQPSLEERADPIWIDKSQLRRAKDYLSNNTEPTLEDFANPIFCKHWEREKRLQDEKEKRDRLRKMAANGEQASPADLAELKEEAFWSQTFVAVFSRNEDPPVHNAKVFYTSI
jgi:hypothetical protein